MEAAGRGQAALAKHGAVAAEVSEVGAGSLGQPKQGRLCLHLGMAVPAPQLSARPGLLLRGPGYPEGTRQSAQHTGEVLKELQGLCCVCVCLFCCVFLCTGPKARDHLRAWFVASSPGSVRLGYLLMHFLATFPC